MRPKKYLRIQGKEQYFSGVETRLGSALTPVSPRAEYIYDLKRNLSAQDFQALPLESPRLDWMLAVLGLASGAIMLIVGVKALIAVLSGLGLINQVKRRLDTERPAPVQPAV